VRAAGHDCPGVQFKKDPSPILPILQNLKDDPSLYVRKSVANNLNDISKDHPEIVIGVARQWKGLHPYTDWIIRHGCRSLKKAGNKDAFQVDGLHSSSKGRVTELLLPQRVKLGELLNFTFSFKNAETKATKFRLDYSIDYITRSGKTSRKIFRIAENTFPPGEKVVISRKRSFKDFSTRKHFRGRHLLSILANGKKLAEKEFIVS
jgi:3-methyladenine DNA glycosylase AlkC